MMLVLENVIVKKIKQNNFIKNKRLYGGGYE